MATDFGTYEGHRILSEAGTRLADRIQKGFQFKKTAELDERKRRDLAKRYDHLNVLSDAQSKEIHDMLPFRQDKMAANTADLRSTTSRRDTLTPYEVNRMQAQTHHVGALGDQVDQATGMSEHNFDRQKADELRGDIGEDIKRKYYTEMSQKLEDFDIYDENIGELRGDAVPLILQAIENTYPTDIMELDPDGKLHIDDVTKIGDDLHRLYTDEVMNRMMTEFSKAGLNKRQIRQLIEANPEMKGTIDSFYRQGLGVNPKEGSSGMSALEDAMYGIPNSQEQYRSTEQALQGYGEDRWGRNKVNVTEDPVSGVIKLQEEDFFWGGDDEYTVDFESDGRPFIRGSDNQRVYLDDHDKLYDEFE